MEIMLERLGDLEDDLMSRAFLYDVPVGYRDGVEATMTAVRALLARVTAAA